MRVHPLVLVTLGLLAGLALADRLPVAHAEGAGSWKCYVVDRFPDPGEAADWKGAKATAEGLNAVAGHVPSGNVLSVQYPTAAKYGSTQNDVGLICVN